MPTLVGFCNDPDKLVLIFDGDPNGAQVVRSVLGFFERFREADPTPDTCERLAFQSWPHFLFFTDAETRGGADLKWAPVPLMHQRQINRHPAHLACVEPLWVVLTFQFPTAQIERATGRRRGSKRTLNGRVTQAQLRASLSQTSTEADMHLRPSLAIMPRSGTAITIKSPPRVRLASYLSHPPMSHRETRAQFDGPERAVHVRVEANCGSNSRNLRSRHSPSPRNTGAAARCDSVRCGISKSRDAH